MFKAFSSFGIHPIPKTSARLGNELIALKHVKETCLCNVRKFGWQDRIINFREANTGLSLSLKSRILSVHYEVYFNQYESMPNAGAAISSEQSGEMFHSCLQRVWDLRFKTRSEHNQRSIRSSALIIFSNLSEGIYARAWYAGGHSCDALIIGGIKKYIAHAPRIVHNITC